MNGKVARFLLLCLLALMVFLVLFPIFKANNYREKESVVLESLQCISKVCVEDKSTGKECYFVNPGVSKIFITVDQDNSDHRTILVEPTNADC